MVFSVNCLTDGNMQHWYPDPVQHETRVFWTKTGMQRKMKMATNFVSSLQLAAIVIID